MSTVPASDAPDSLQPPAFVPEPTVTVGRRARPFGFALPWWDRLPAARRTLLSWTIVFALLLVLPFIDTNGGDLDGFANAGILGGLNQWAHALGNSTGVGALKTLALDYGKKITEGEPASIQANPLVIEAYLGKRRKHA